MVTKAIMLMKSPPAPCVESHDTSLSRLGDHRSLRLLLLGAGSLVKRYGHWMAARSVCAGEGSGAIP